MRLYSYVVTSDTGFAPNPHGGVLTLATCKPDIRRTAQKGDWIVDTGSVGLGKVNHLIYAGKISKIMSISDYGQSEEYEFKRPENDHFGDNIYDGSQDGNWVQRTNPFHNEAGQKKDLSGENVLICNCFWYFGRSAPLLPDSFHPLVKVGPKHKNNEDKPELINDFINWLCLQKPGLQGQPSTTDSSCGDNSC